LAQMCTVLVTVSSVYNQHKNLDTIVTILLNATGSWI